MCSSDLGRGHPMCGWRGVRKFKRSGICDQSSIQTLGYISINVLAQLRLLHKMKNHLAGGTHRRVSVHILSVVSWRFVVIDHGHIRFGFGELIPHDTSPGQIVKIQSENNLGGFDEAHARLCLFLIDQQIVKSRHPI